MSALDEGLTRAAAATAAAEIVDLYTRHADVWAKARGDALSPDEALHLNCFMSSLSSGAELLDLGCGSGRPVAATLIARGFRVTGVDTSPGLIDLCRGAFPEQGWIVADMRGLDLGRRFGGLLAWYSAFHLTAEEQQAMAAVYGRHLKPGGRLIFVGGPRRGVAMGEWMGRPLHHASLDPTEYRAGLEAAGFDDVEERVLKSDADEGARVWTARRKTSD